MGLSTILGLVLIFLTTWAHLKYKITEFDISQICGEIAGIVCVVCFAVVMNKYFDYQIHSMKEFWGSIVMLFILKTYGWWILWKKK